ncbi:uncharacterized protein [Coffea arabica]|uniref:Uncharacterized protein n=1 Tax=Coffea arabica TaxID=13443 RepID=A0ABM4W819_COFAR
MDSEHGSGSSRLPRISEADVDLDDSFDPSTVMDFEHSGGSRTNSEIATSEVAASTIDTSKSFNSLPSSSSENSSHVFFQVNPAMIPMSKTSDHESPPKSEENANSLLKDGKNDVLFQLEELFGSLHSSSQKSDVTDEFVIPILSPTHSPPIQVMERPRGYDPDRIPASVFAKPASPVDWSVASTESLFSIPIGNASFSRDHAFKPVGDTNKPNEFGNSGELYVSEEFYKSGELDTFSEQYRYRELQKSSELVRLRQHSPVTKGEHKAQGADLPNRTIRDEGGINLEAKSFANPIKKKSSKSSCACCSNCCYKCPSCCCKCPGCSSCCCKWPSCSCKWPGCSICCCKSPCCSCKSLSCPWKWSCFPSCC